MSTTINIKKAMLSSNKALVDENNLEIEPNSIIYCLGSLFQVTDTGLRHIVGKKIDDDTYFADSDLYICDAAQVWGGPRATEHTKECLLPRRPGC